MNTPRSSFDYICRMFCAFSSLPHQTPSNIPQIKTLRRFRLVSTLLRTQIFPYNLNILDYVHLPNVETPSFDGSRQCHTSINELPKLLLFCSPKSLNIISKASYSTYDVLRFLLFIHEISRRTRYSRQSPLYCVSH